MTNVTEPTVGFLKRHGSASSAFHICPDFRIVIDGNTRCFMSSGALCGAKSDYSWGLRGKEPTCEKCIKIQVGRQ